MIEPFHVYTLLQRETHETYEILLNAVDDLCARTGIAANLTHIMTDFEASCLVQPDRCLGMMWQHTDVFFLCKFKTKNQPLLQRIFRSQMAAWKLEEVVTM